MVRLGDGGKFTIPFVPIFKFSRLQTRPRFRRIKCCWACHFNYALEQFCEQYSRDPDPEMLSCIPCGTDPSVRLTDALTFLRYGFPLLEDYSPSWVLSVNAHIKYARNNQQCVPTIREHAVVCLTCMSEQCNCKEDIYLLPLYYSACLICREIDCRCYIECDFGILDNRNCINAVQVPKFQCLGNSRHEAFMIINGLISDANFILADLYRLQVGYHKKLIRRSCVCSLNQAFWTTACLSLSPVNGDICRALMRHAHGDAIT